MGSMVEKILLYPPLSKDLYQVGALDKSDNRYFCQ